MKIPTTLKHKPVLTVENYEQVDGRYAYHSDAKGLSLGLAQWNDRGRVEISAKVWRYTGEKWSRQSEELPLHRVLDLAILIVRGMQYMQEESYRLSAGYDPAAPVPIIHSLRWGYKHGTNQQLSFAGGAGEAVFSDIRSSRAHSETETCV